MYFNGFTLLYVLRMNGAGPFKNKEKTPKVPSFNLNHLNFNNILDSYPNTILLC